MPLPKQITPLNTGTSDQILIAGAGAIGLSLALALKQGVGERFKIIVVDPALDHMRAASAKVDARAYAVAAAARRMLEALDVWDGVAAHAQPIHEMLITDSHTHDVVRPVFLNFAEERPEGEPFAQIVMAEALNDALEAAARARGIVFLPERVAKTDVQKGHVSATLSGGKTLKSRLVVAADGAKSQLREASGLGWIAQEYAQSGIVATIIHQRPHHGRAIEHFMPGGPFAMLPLPDDATGQHRSSIVWSEPSENVPALLSLKPEDFTREVEARFGLELGEITLGDQPRSFPLGFGVARQFYGDRLVLVGDAAHIVHPIAGQGLNLGLKDVAVLAEKITDAARLGLDIGADNVLQGYERARRADTVMMGAGMDMLNRLFSNDVTPIRLARDLGLGLVDRSPALKHFFIAQAAGETGSPPRLMSGKKL